MSETEDALRVRMAHDLPRMETRVSKRAQYLREQRISYAAMACYTTHSADSASKSGIYMYCEPRMALHNRGVRCRCTSV